jgi:hypothetical protein
VVELDEREHPLGRGGDLGAGLPSISSPKATFWATVRCGKRA